MAAALLRGVRVLSLTAGIAGPATARTLGQAGAEVIKFESNDGGLDSFRNYSTSDDPEASGRFMENNLNVLTAELNLKSATGVRLFLELAAKSDIVLDNFRPGVLPRLGLGPEELRKARPDIITMKLPGMGSTGPKSWYGTWGQTLNAVSGMTYLWNHPELERPVGFQGAYPDYVAAALAPTVLMAALLRRRRTGTGVHLELTQAEMAAYMLGVSYLQAEINGRDPAAIGNDWPYAAPHNCYPCRGQDRWCVIAVETEAQWRRLCTVVGQPRLVDDERFCSLRERRRHRAALDAAITVWTGDRDATEVMRLMQAAGVPCGVVQTGEDLYRDPQLRARQLLRTVEHPALGQVPVATLPIHLSRHDFAPPLAMKPLGGDNERVYCGILGYSRAQLDAWQQDGVVR